MTLRVNSLRSVLVPLSAAIVLAVWGWSVTQPSPAAALEYAAAPSAAAVLEVAGTRGTVAPSSQSTVTLSASAPTGASIILSSPRLTVRDGSGRVISTYVWTPDPHIDGVCGRCHPPTVSVGAGRTIAWSVPVVAPAAPGSYVIEGTAKADNYDVQSASLVLQSAGTARPRPGERAAMALLASAHLSLLGSAASNGGTVTSDDIRRYSAPSRALGLSMTGLLGDTAQTLRYNVQLRGAPADATVSATFFIEGGRVVAAGQTVEGLLGGMPRRLGSLADFE